MAERPPPFTLAGVIQAALVTMLMGVMAWSVFPLQDNTVKIGIIDTRLNLLERDVDRMRAHDDRKQIP